MWALAPSRFGKSRAASPTSSRGTPRRNRNRPAALSFMEFLHALAHVAEMKRLDMTLYTILTDPNAPIPAPAAATTPATTATRGASYRSLRRGSSVRGQSSTPPAKPTPPRKARARHASSSRSIKPQRSYRLAPSPLNTAAALRARGSKLHPALLQQLAETQAVEASRGLPWYVVDHPWDDEATSQAQLLTSIGKEPQPASFMLPTYAAHTADSTTPLASKVEALVKYLVAPDAVSMATSNATQLSALAAALARAWPTHGPSSSNNNHSSAAAVATSGAGTASSTRSFRLHRGNSSYTVMSDAAPPHAMSVDAARAALAVVEQASREDPSVKRCSTEVTAYLAACVAASVAIAVTPSQQGPTPLAAVDGGVAGGSGGRRGSSGANTSSSEVALVGGLPTQSRNASDALRQTVAALGAGAGTGAGGVSQDQLPPRSPAALPSIREGKGRGKVVALSVDTGGGGGGASQSSASSPRAALATPTQPLHSGRRGRRATLARDLAALGSIAERLAAKSVSP